MSCAVCSCVFRFACVAGVARFARVARTARRRGVQRPPRRRALVHRVFASAAALKEADCRLSDVGVVELNEAFASQVLACERAFSSKEFAKEHLGVGRAVGTLDLDRTNKNGGAIAIGHPVGATGARLLLTAAHELEESDEELALATLCIGGGQGGAVVLERMST